MTRTGRNDIRRLLIDSDMTLAELGRQLGVTPVRVGQAIDDPSPHRGRRIKVRVARAVGRRVEDLWPTKEAR